MGNELPLHIQRAIRRYGEIEMDGIILYPVRVEEYEAFTLARPALEALQQSFPVHLLSIPILAAEYRMSYDAAVEGVQAPNLLAQSLLGLSLSLRLGEGLDSAERVKLWRLVVDPKDPKRLLRVSCLLHGEEIVEITPAQYQRIRPIIAAQNGVELYGDDANPDLVQAEQDLAQMNGAKLAGGVEEMVGFAALACGVEEEDIYRWPILKLTNRIESARRVLDYLICGIGECQGTTWKGGNPCPHPWFTKLKETSGALMKLSDFAGGEGLNAYQRAMAGTTQAPGTANAPQGIEGTKE